MGNLKLTDFDTDKMRINELKSTLERMEKEKARIEEWVKEKERKCDEFEARAEVKRNELIEIQHKVDKDTQALEKLKHEVFLDQAKLNQSIKENQDLKTENTKIFNEATAKLEVIRVKEKELHDKDLEVSGKLNKWASIKEAFLKI